MFETKQLHVAIETKGEFSCGMSVVDALGVSGKQPNANVALHLNQEAFWSLLEQAIRE